MKRYFAYAAVALAFFLCTLTYFTCIKRTKGFCYTKIHSRYGYNDRWDFGTPTKSQEKLLDQIAEQPFSLLGSGKECYAFVSADGEIVVKFFKQKHLRTQYILNYLPVPKVIQALRNETLNRHTVKRKALYQSYQIAYERLPEETGVLYLHLTKTKYLKRAIHIKTPKGKNLTLKLDDMEFMVQKRAYSIFDEIIAHPENGKKTINSILQLIAKRNKKGIGDNDINCERNLGILEGKAIQIDVGEFYPALPKQVTKKELRRATLDLQTFLDENHPELASYLESQVNTLL
ncbi:MAG: hypothetical protein KFB93_05325 [Simkaniaceae bacterium]|nr:MAG: hypothetical protein KFB93_05325 [Simkaniaceae bacterium]